MRITVILTFNALSDTLDELKNNVGSNDRKSSHQARSILENIKSDRFSLLHLLLLRFLI